MKEQILTLKKVFKVVGALPIASGLLTPLGSSPVLAFLLCLCGLICWLASQWFMASFEHKSKVVELEPDKLRAQAKLLLAQAEANKIARSG